jgi:hypothetical protein
MPLSPRSELCLRTVTSPAVSHSQQLSPSGCKEDGQMPPVRCRVLPCWQLRLRLRRLGMNGSVRYPICSWDFYCRSRLERSLAVPVPKQLHRSRSSSRPNGPYLRRLVAGTAGVAEVDAMHPSAVHKDPYSMIVRALTLRTQPHGKSNGLHCLDCEPTTPLV